MDDPVWDVTVFTKNRDRLLDGEIASKFFAAVLDDARVKGLLSDEHFSVDGTLIQAWASLKSFRPKDGSGKPPAPGRNGERDFKGEKRSNETHRSTTDDDARLFRKGDGQQSQLCFIGHVLMENRSGLAVEAELTRATGTAERLAALAMAENLRASPKTIGADKGYDTHDFVMELRELGITPHVAQNAYDAGTARHIQAIDGRTTRHDGYAGSQKKRKRIEEIFGWLKTIGGLAPDQVPRPRPGAHGLHLRPCRLQPHPHAKARGKNRMRSKPSQRRNPSHSDRQPPATCRTATHQLRTEGKKSAHHDLFPQPVRAWPEKG